MKLNYPIISAFFKIARRFWRFNSASTTVEFVVIFPFFLFVFMLIFELGFMMVRVVFFERGVDITARELKLLGSLDWQGEAVSNLKKSICNNTVIFTDCSNDLELEIIRLSEAQPLPITIASCKTNLSETPPILNTVNPEDIVMLRACLNVHPIFASLTGGIFKNNIDGTFSLVTSTIFVTETGS